MMSPGQFSESVASDDGALCQNTVSSFFPTKDESPLPGAIRGCHSLGTPIREPRVLGAAELSRALCSQLGEKFEQMLSQEHLWLQGSLSAWLDRLESSQREQLAQQTQLLEKFVSSRRVAVQDNATPVQDSTPGAAGSRNSLPVRSSSGNLSGTDAVPTPGNRPESPKIPRNESTNSQKAWKRELTGTSKESKGADRTRMSNADNPVTPQPPISLAVVPTPPGNATFASATAKVVPLEPETTQEMMTTTCSPEGGWRTVVKAHEEQERTKKKGKKRARTFLFQAKVDDQLMGRSHLQRFVQSRTYELASGLLIFTNAIFIGWQTQWTAERAKDRAEQGLHQVVVEPLVFVVCQQVYTFAFLLELCVRWYADGLYLFWYSADRWWNLFDVIVVSFGCLDFILDVLLRVNEEDNQVLANISLLRVMRVVRIVRVAKVIRTMRFFRELRMMVYSILGSLKSLMWSMMVLNVMFFLFGISLTTGTVDFLSDTDMWYDEQYADLRHFFGTLDRSILSLYMSMSGGRDWCEYYEVLTDLPSIYRWFFLTFISIAIVSVMNIVTGVFVDNAMKANETDRDFVIHEELESKKEYLIQMQDIFEEMDDDNTGCISIDEFEKRLDDERVIAYFNALKLDVSDARTLFQLLDYDQSGEIAVDEFLAGCHKLKGESRSLDIAIMQYELKWIKEAFQGFADFTESTLTELKLMSFPGSTSRSSGVFTQNLLT